MINSIIWIKDMVLCPLNSSYVNVGTICKKCPYRRRIEVAFVECLYEYKQVTTKKQENRNGAVNP